MKILKNPSIPSTMTSDGLDFLGMMAKSVPENGVIVEIGPLFGSSTWVLAKNAHPSVRVFSIDTWEPAEWIDKVEAKYKNCKPFSKEAFLHYTRDCPNVTAIQGWSPEVVKDWDLPIDLFFDDATHGDPGFSENVNFFLPFVKDGSVLCGDDYSSGWPDIVRVVDELGNRWGVHPEVSGRVWAMRKPNSGTQSEQKVFASVSDIDRSPSINVNCETVSGKQYALSNSIWSGAVHKKDRLKKITLEAQGQGQSLDIEWNIKDSKGEVLGPFRSGSSFECAEEDWISSFSVKLVGGAAKLFDVEYQACFCWFSGEGKRYPLSGYTKNGQFVESQHSKLAVCAVRIKLVEKKAVAKNKIVSIINNVKVLTPTALFEKIKSRLLS